MYLKKLQIENLRNLAQVDITPHPRLNFLFGTNGAGKTSVLESIVVLSRGRTFRTNQASELIGPGAGTFRVFAESVGDNGKGSRLGLERSGKNWRARKDGSDLTQLSQLTRALPLVWMEPNSHLLVSGPPETRRRFLDWGMFHVEQGFLDAWRRFSKILKQRNAALRFRQEGVLDSVDEVFAEQGARLGSMRKSHACEISRRVRDLLGSLHADLEEIALEYKDGWPGGDLLAALGAGRDRDLARGVSGTGPHRADMDITHGGSRARGVLSRGEQKILSAALLFAQAEVLSGLGEKPIILLDDLASEFDQERYESALSVALNFGGQVWVTGTRMTATEAEHKVFHVEHGEVAEMV